MDTAAGGPAAICGYLPPLKSSLSALFSQARSVTRWPEGILLLLWEHFWLLSPKKTSLFKASLWLNSLEALQSGGSVCHLANFMMTF